MNISPTDNAEPVALKTRIPAARSVSAVPIVETSWADQSSRKSRFRNTENVLGRGAPGSSADGTPPEPDGDPAAGSVAVAESVTDRSLFAPSRRLQIHPSGPAECSEASDPGSPDPARSTGQPSRSRAGRRMPSSMSSSRLIASSSSRDPNQSPP